MGEAVAGVFAERQRELAMIGREPVAFHVVTGFLGSGKTTLINALLRSDALADAMVLVNEWGEIGLDHLLYERLSGEAILIAGGCVCCAVRGDLVEALGGLLARRDAGELPRFRRIILETSGLAEPGPILQALAADPEASARIAAASVTTLVDAINGLETLDRHAESPRQVALADRLVITKSDLLPAEERAPRLAALVSALRDLNPLAPIFDAAAGEFGPSQLVATVPPPRFAASFAAHSKARPIETFALRTTAPIGPQALEGFLSALGGLLGPRLLRLKGLVALADGSPVLVEAVQHVLHRPRRLADWPDEDRATRMVVIVERDAAPQVEALWSALIRAPRPDTPDLAALTDNPLAPRPGGLLG